MKRAPDFTCKDCGENTAAINEYYMVLRRLWNFYAPGVRMLCVGCLEKRMGRELQPGDFHPCRVNEHNRVHGSPRLRARLRGLPEDFTIRSAII